MNKDDRNVYLLKSILLIKLEGFTCNFICNLKICRFIIIFLKSADFIIYLGKKEMEVLIKIRCKLKNL